MHLTYIRTILYRGTFCLAKSNRKNIMTTPRKMQEVLEDLKGNPYYDKYASKISKLQQSKPEEFTSRIEDIVKTRKPKKIEPPRERQYSELLQPKQKLLEKQETQEESLEKIMKVDLIKDKTAEEIKLIWQDYHIQKECISAIIPSEEFAKLQENGKKYPTFLFPLPRSQGYEFIMCQFEKNSVHFTPLLCYQVHKENAPECLTVKHYDDLKDDKGIVLMRGEYDKNVVNAKEAQCLANQLKLYYLENDSEKRRLLEIFNYKPDEFKHSELIKQIENISL